MINNTSRYLQCIKSHITGSLDVGQLWPDYITHFYPREDETTFSASVAVVNQKGKI